MKTLNNWLLSLAVIGTLTLTACSKNESGGASSGAASVDTSAIQKAFASAEPVLKETVSKAVEAVKSADYSAALTSLNNALSDAKITPEQKAAVQSLIEKVKSALTSKTAGDATKAAEDAAKKGTDAIKSALPK